MTAHLDIRLVSSDQLQALVEAFLDDCTLLNLSSETLARYRGQLGRYRWWCQGANVPLDPTLHTASTLRGFLLYLKETGVRRDLPDHPPSRKPVTPATQRNYYRTLRRFFSWLVEQEYLDHHPMGEQGRRKVKSPLVVEDQPDPFSAEELERLAAVLNRGEGVLAERNRAIVAVLLDVGPRAPELVKLQVADLDPTSSDLQVVRGKGGKSRQLRLGAMARRQVRRYWLRHRRHHGDSGPFFLNHRGKPLTRDGLGRMTEELGRAASVAPCNPHRFRHTAAVSALRGDESIRAAGHARA